MTKRKSMFKPGWGLALLAVTVVIAGAIWLYRAPIHGYAAAGTAYSARVACSCRFVAGRSLDDCAKDKLAGMELVRLSEDDEARSVTASFPLVRSDTASYREGYGCVLQDWQS
ncbi:hypothetical protein [Qipengyuania atrilutea]|uniref:Uncharacterized protein n=1 Tax=Qipengyuania atrilutea TaxID=2744473 RepID=A0A850H3D0_9SPHN|nr:hypothetical protein [Actirhodobacter atriluteus]NVD44383.1 hypothetical protein [Actirhodobacter atriluteus]